MQFTSCINCINFISEKVDGVLLTACYWSQTGWSKLSMSSGGLSLHRTGLSQVVRDRVRSDLTYDAGNTWWWSRSVSLISHNHEIVWSNTPQNSVLYHTNSCNRGNAEHCCDKQRDRWSHNMSHSNNLLCGESGALNTSLFESNVPVLLFFFQFRQTCFGSATSSW